MDNALLEHNRLIRRSGVTIEAEAAIGEKTGTICILARDGRLFGPFVSRSAAIYWVKAQELEGFSTYDLLSPREPQEDIVGG